VTGSAPPTKPQQLLRRSKNHPDRRHRDYGARLNDLENPHSRADRKVLAARQQPV
jgi:hypothetical protein